MIKIRRGNPPDVLVGKPMYDSNRYKRCLVEALWQMQHGKCCYSETHIPPTGHGKTVEHFYPKSIFGWKRNEWRNLLLACPHCNGQKSNKFPTVISGGDEDDGIDQIVVLDRPTEGTPAILDPSDPDTNPEDHLSYYFDDDCPLLWGQVVPRNQSNIGRATIDATGIDAPHFLRGRAEHYSDILFRAYLRMVRLLRDERFEALRTAVSEYMDHMQPQSQYAGMAREFARAKRMDKHFGEYGLSL